MGQGQLACGLKLLRMLLHLHARHLLVGAVALAAAGPVFCAGGNPYGSSGPTLATSLASSSQQLLASVQVCAHGSTGLCACSGHLLTSHLCAVQGFADVRDLRFPTVCALHGAMVGGAAAIFLHSDLRVAETEATFQHGNLSRGVCPVAGYSHTLQAAIGTAHTYGYAPT